MGDSGHSIEATTAQQRKTLATVLVLNLLLAAALAAGGVFADSSGLVANALDNMSDAVVYALSLFAIGRAPKWKSTAAAASGILLIVFGLGVLADTWRRYVEGSEPVGLLIIGFAVFAAVINLICLRLLTRLQTGDVNVKAARTFSYNDFISNGGILAAGLLVMLLGQRWPDLVAGLAVTAIALKGGVEILIDAWKARSDAAGA